MHLVDFTVHRALGTARPFYPYSSLIFYMFIGNILLMLNVNVLLFIGLWNIQNPLFDWVYFSAYNVNNSNKCAILNVIIRSFYQCACPSNFKVELITFCNPFDFFKLEK